MVDEVENKDYEINSSSVYEDMKKDYSFHGRDDSIETNFPYLDAYIDTKNNIVKDLNIKGVGKCQLYIKLDENYPRKVTI